MMAESNAFRVRFLELCGLATGVGGKPVRSLIKSAGQRLARIRHAGALMASCSSSVGTKAVQVVLRPAALFHIGTWVRFTGERQQVKSMAAEKLPQIGLRGSDSVAMCSLLSAIAGGLASRQMATGRLCIQRPRWRGALAETFLGGISRQLM